MKRPYLIPLIGFCVLAVLVAWSLYADDHPRRKRHVSVKSIHIKLPSEENKSPFQMAYEKACSDMQYKNYNDVKKYCLKVLKENPNQSVSSGELRFKVGPAALNMLADVYIAEKNYNSAMSSFQQMIDLYRDDNFKRYQEGEAYWEGKAGAAGMLGQIRILTEINKDLPKANIVLFRLIDFYKGQYPKRWEWKESYDSAGMQWITKYLQENSAPINQWETEINAVINKTVDKELKFNLEMTLARKYATDKMADQTAKLYHKIIAEHEMEYWASVEDGSFFYGMEAYKELIDFYQKIGRKDRVDAEKLKMKALYEKLLVYVKTKNIEFGAETLEGYKPYFSPGE